MRSEPPSFCGYSLSTKMIDRKRAHVDTTHLLSEHDHSGSDSGSSNSGDGEELHSPSEVGVSSDDLLFLDKLNVNVV